MTQIHNTVHLWFIYFDMIYVCISTEDTLLIFEIFNYDMSVEHTRIYMRGSLSFSYQTINVYMLYNFTVKNNAE